MKVLVTNFCLNSLAKHEHGKSYFSMARHEKRKSCFFFTTRHRFSQFQISYFNSIFITAFVIAITLSLYCSLLISLIRKRRYVCKTCEAIYLHIFVAQNKLDLDSLISMKVSYVNIYYNLIECMCFREYILKASTVNGCVGSNKSSSRGRSSDSSGRGGESIFNIILHMYIILFKAICK